MFIIGIVGVVILFVLFVGDLVGDLFSIVRDLFSIVRYLFSIVRNLIGKLDVSETAKTEVTTEDIVVKPTEVEKCLSKDPADASPRRDDATGCGETVAEGREA